MRNLYSSHNSYYLTQIHAIVTHTGQAHRDEYMAIGLVLALREELGLSTDLPIERRDPTEAELEDPTVLVVDVGGRHEPELSNFDHHQFERGTVACALSLVAEACEVDQVLQFSDWYEITARLDSCGPMAVAKHLNLESFPFALWSPLEKQLLVEFEANPQGEAQIAKRLVAGLLRFAKELASEVERARDIAQVQELESGLEAIVFDELVSPSASARVRDEYVADGHPVYVLITHDDRGAGWMMFRYEDHPRVDFSALGGHQSVLFAHNGGFIAKTHQRLPLDEVLELTKSALVSPKSMYLET